jgi:hypothetical protein
MRSHKGCILLFRSFWNASSEFPESNGAITTRSPAHNSQREKLPYSTGYRAAAAQTRNGTPALLPRQSFCGGKLRNGLSKAMPHEGSPTAEDTKILLTRLAAGENVTAPRKTGRSARCFCCSTRSPASVAFGTPCGNRAHANLVVVSPFRTATERLGTRAGKFPALGTASLAHLRKTR